MDIVTEVALKKEVDRLREQDSDITDNDVYRSVIRNVLYGTILHSCNTIQEMRMREAATIARKPKHHRQGRLQHAQGASPFNSKLPFYLRDKGLLGGKRHKR